MPYAIILAAGSSKRFDGNTRKQYTQLAGKPVLRHSVDLFESLPSVAGYTILVPESDLERVREQLPEDSTDGLRGVRAGGSSRRESVYRGLQFLESREPDSVFVHDAARPGTSRELVQRLLERWNRDRDELAGVVPAIPLSDTIKRVDPNDSDRVQETLPRDQLRAVQTPQLFDFEQLLAVHRHWDESQPVTDDAMMLEHRGESIGLVPGDPQNRKITRRVDYETLRVILGPTDTDPEL